MLSVSTFKGRKLLMWRRTTGVGLLARILSIFAIISGVSLGMTSRALRLSTICWGRVAPKMTVDVLGFLATHARAKAVGVVFNSVNDTIMQRQS